MLCLRSEFARAQALQVNVPLRVRGSLSFLPTPALLSLDSSRQADSLGCRLRDACDIWIGLVNANIKKHHLEGLCLRVLVGGLFNKMDYPPPTRPPDTPLPLRFPCKRLRLSSASSRVNLASCREIITKSEKTWTTTVLVFPKSISVLLPYFWIAVAQYSDSSFVALVLI